MERDTRVILVQLHLPAWYRDQLKQIAIEQHRYMYQTVQEAFDKYFAWWEACKKNLDSQ